jgi:hypothetical protein
MKPQWWLVSKMDVDTVLDTLALHLFGRTRREAWDTKTCIECKASIADRWYDMTTDQRDEYAISALCPACFDTFAKEDE